jgi:tripartite-type tricarboxylate transporter receptor subunit TctC
MSKLDRRKFVHLAAGAAALPAVSRIAGAQAYPTRPVSMIVPFGAGASADVLGRILALGMSQTLGQQVIVENVGGAGGMNGASRVARASPDGYQFVLGYASTHAFNQTIYKSPLYNAATDFTPVVLVSEIQLVLVTRKDFPANSLQEFVAYTKANQAKMQYGSAGVGSSNHAVCLLLNSTIGVNVTHVPYRASGIPDLLAGRLDYYCQLVAAALPLIESKQMKALALLSKTRVPILPDLPTADEQGLASFDATTWNAVFLPKGAPAAIVNRLRDATIAALEIPSVRRRMIEAGASIPPPEHQTSDYLKQFVVSEIEKWAVALKAANVTAE